MDKESWRFKDVHGAFAIWLMRIDIKCILSRGTDCQCIDKHG